MNIDKIINNIIKIIINRKFTDNIEYTSPVEPTQEEQKKQVKNILNEVILKIKDSQIHNLIPRNIINDDLRRELKIKIIIEIYKKRRY